MEGLWEWQWRERIEPYWRGLSRSALATAPEVAVCLELAAGLARRGGTIIVEASAP